MINIRPSDNILQVAANRNDRISFCLGLMWYVKELIERQNGTFFELVAQKTRWIEMSESINPRCVC